MDKETEAALMAAGHKMQQMQAEIERLRAALVDMTADRDSWCEQTQEREKDALALVAAERERLRSEIEAKRCTPMFPGGHSFNHGVDAALECLRA